MDVVEAIDRQLRRLEYFYNNDCLSVEEYMEMCEPLHKALVVLAMVQVNTTGSGTTSTV